MLGQGNDIFTVSTNSKEPNDRILIRQIDSILERAGIAERRSAAIILVY
jgi:hypothetical protein